MPKSMRDNMRQYILERVERRQAVEGFTECWEWTRRPGTQGYGYAGSREKREVAHRAAYREFVGDIPDGAQVDHLCANRICVNPDHLEAVTPAVNVQRAATRAGSPGYSVFQRADGRWVAAVDVRAGKPRLQKRFTHRDRATAEARLTDFLDARA